MNIGLNELSKINLKPTTLEEALVVIAQMAEIIIRLGKTIEDLTERLNLNSNNSSKPPSTNLKNNKKHTGKGKSGKKRGAQPGHKGKHRELLPPEKVDQFITCVPPEHCDCGGIIQLNNSNFQKHQVYEIPQPHYTGLSIRFFQAHAVVVIRGIMDNYP